MSTPNVKTQSGNRVVVEFDGQQFGLVQSVRMNDEYGHEPASGIGDARAQEYVPGMARHSLQVSSMVLKVKNMRQLGIYSENSANVLLGLVFDIVVYDKDTNSVLRAYRSCTYTGGDVEVTAHRILMHSGTFAALDVDGTGI